MVWGNVDLRGMIFSFYVSPTRVFMYRVPPLPYHPPHSCCVCCPHRSAFYLPAPREGLPEYLDSPAFQKLTHVTCPANDEIAEEFRKRWDLLDR